LAHVVANAIVGARVPLRPLAEVRRGSGRRGRCVARRTISGPVLPIRAGPRAPPRAVRPLSALLAGAVSAGPEMTLSGGTLPVERPVTEAALGGVTARVVVGMVPRA